MAILLFHRARESQERRATKPLGFIRAQSAQPKKPSQIRILWHVHVMETPLNTVDPTDPTIGVGTVRDPLTSMSNFPENLKLQAVTGNSVSAFTNTFTMILMNVVKTLHHWARNGVNSIIGIFKCDHSLIELFLVQPSHVHLNLCPYALSALNFWGFIHTGFSNNSTTRSGWLNKKA